MLVWSDPQMIGVNMWTPSCSAHSMELFGGVVSKNSVLCSAMSGGASSSGIMQGCRNSVPGKRRQGGFDENDVAFYPDSKGLCFSYP